MRSVDAAVGAFLRPRFGVFFSVVGLLLLAWLLNTPAGLMGKADAVGYAVCHRINLRSFHLGDRQLPLCARCTGMYLGAVLGLGFQAWIGARRGGLPPKRILILLAGCVLAFALDGVNSYLHLFPAAPTLYEPQNWLRLVTGTGMGIGIAALLYPAFNRTLWRKPDRRPALPNVLVLMVLLGMALVLDLVVLTGNPLVLYPLALISAAGVVLILTMVYGMAGVLLLKIENRYEHWTQLPGLAAAGFGLALLQIGLMDAARYWLTQTWGGFPLG